VHHTDCFESCGRRSSPIWLRLLWIDAVPPVAWHHVNIQASLPATRIHNAENWPISNISILSRAKVYS